jgi:hypothetical protein
MSELLDFAIAAHGGMDRWRSLSSLTVSASVGGALWPAKGKAGILDDLQAEVNCHQQRVICSPFTAPDRRSVYEPDRVRIPRKTDPGPYSCGYRHQRCQGCLILHAFYLKSRG